MSDDEWRLSAADILTAPETAAASLEHRFIQACETGDVSALKKLIPAANADPSTATQMPRPEAMFGAAAEHKQAETVTYLSSVFQDVKLYYTSAMFAAFKHEDPATLRALLMHDPSIANYEENYTTKFQELCGRPDPTLALLMLEFGADPSWVAMPLAMPLAAAARGAPMVLIEKLVERGARIEDFVLQCAQDQGRDDVVKYLSETKEK